MKKVSLLKLKKETLKLLSDADLAAAGVIGGGSVPSRSNRER
jgi:hypothetical protein